MLAQYDREVQQSSQFFFRSQDDKKNWRGVEAERKERKFLPSLTSQFMSSFMGAVTMRCVVRSSRFQTKKVIIPQELDNFAWRFRLSPVELFVKKTFQLISVGICHFLRPWNSQHHDLWSNGESKSQATSSNRGELKSDRARASGVRVKVNVFTVWALLPSRTISLTIPWHVWLL